MRARPTLNLREVGLAQTFSDFAFHGFHHFELGNGTPESAQGTFDGTERANFIA